ncbi:MAG: hypothetical protein VW551_00765 [Euryarchaeota archaeon]|jgi:hypothetical protein
MEEEKPMRFLALIITIILVSGCSSMPQRIEVSAKPVDKPQLILPDAQKLNLRDVEFILITRENAEEVFAELERSRKDPVLIGLTDDGYETLSLNLSEVMALLQQQKAIIAAYKRYYQESEEALDKANANIEGAKEQVEAQQDIEEPSILESLNPFSN